MSRKHSKPGHRLRLCEAGAPAPAGTDLVSRPSQWSRGRHMLSRVRRGFSLIEMLIAISISAALMTSMMVALDTMFKGYQQTSGAVSTNVVSRLAINRVLGMIRTGSDFGPFPTDVLDNARNPLRADYFEYVSRRNPTTNAVTEITRVEFRYPGHDALLRSWGASSPAPELTFSPTGTGSLWLVTLVPGSNTRTDTMLLPNVRSAEFTMSYDVGPKLTRATVDLVIESLEHPDIELEAGAAPATIRLVASAMPRRSADSAR